MDVGTRVRTLGARREMLVGFLAEPALLMVLFTASLISQSTSLTTIVETLAHRELAIYPSLALAGVAFTIVSLAENARVPVDNPATHLELTMIHEALILEYRLGPRAARMGGRAQALRLLGDRPGPLLSLGAWPRRDPPATSCFGVPRRCSCSSSAWFALFLAVLETVSAKMRIFRVPEFLATAFLLAVMAMLTRILLGA